MVRRKLIRLRFAGKYDGSVEELQQTFFPRSTEYLVLRVRTYTDILIDNTIAVITGKYRYQVLYALMIHF